MLSTDGSSDRLLMSHIDWALSRLCDCDFSGEWADPRVFEDSSREVEIRAAQAIANYDCNLLFMHRDAENQQSSARHIEIEEGIRRAAIGTRYVAIVPIRMTEAWLLADEAAIRRAAGNPNGNCQISIPAINSIERLVDPKSSLARCLEEASEKNGRRLDIFRRDIPDMKHRVAELICEFEQLLILPSFRKFYDDIAAALQVFGCLRGVGG